MPSDQVIFDQDNPEWTEEDFMSAVGPADLSPIERSAFPNTRAADEDDSRYHVLNLDHAASGELREAYFKLLLAGERAGYRAKAGTGGPKRDLHFLRSGAAPFALIVNRSDILFYLRKPSLRDRPALETEAFDRFSDAHRTLAGEVTIRLRTLDDARRLSSWLFAA